ncbi:hypothetical protein QBC38DRAFT_428846 [Podospora fimiseda]|uniref:Rhodopsin domain-containing protein n=1 Tax=Podospora fimiseda TaxID=252190 RepID=A0AAN6YRS7_9PEZI|nr:hypothetical protein QBC38DRAFT_428846 [Podospora fimiseda]
MSANRTELTQAQLDRAAESNSKLFITIVCVVWAFAFVTALVRFYTRAIVVRSFGKDDIFMVLAVLCGIGGLTSWIIACNNGYGRHQDTIPRSTFIVLVEAQFFQSVIEASFAFGFLKISIALSLLRLSRGKRYKWILWALIWFTCFYTIFAFITFMTFCDPIAGQWNPGVRPKCYSRVLYRNFGLFNASCNIVTDICFATLPIPLIWSLQLQRRIRIYLIAILSGGYFAVGLGIAKAVYIIAYVHESDGTFYPFAPFFGSLQLDIGIIAACAPTLRPLLGRFLNITHAINGYRGAANYYRAGRALDRIPPPPAAYRHPRATDTIGSAGRFSGKRGLREKDEWGITSLNSCGATTVVHAEHVGIPRGTPDSVDSEKGLTLQVDEDMILPLTENPEFRGIVKTTEFRIEK